VADIAKSFSQSRRRQSGGKQVSSENAGATKPFRSATSGIKLGGFLEHSSVSPAPRQQVLQGKAGIVVQ
jgi:hypothetical protein